MNKEVPESKSVNESRTVKSGFVLPSATNNYHTMFGGKLLEMIDEVAAISATRHARMVAVTASIDSVDFLYPIKEGNGICLESFVSWTHNTSMEVFVKVISEDLFSGERKVCTTAFVTFVALGENKKPIAVPKVIPETEEEIALHESAPFRAKARKERREKSRQLANNSGIKKPWE
ncbi:acyl-CoA thioesterase [Bacillus taeanensis]|uniref:Acyl-CoA thioesterase n=1 Tax=Bacillus taeanensis TaxID=273032 RepID=A0A366Y1B0_9BACI|nr:acyl-CoA thioesterase [Bacillus taeanensis]RBW71626.1 acyl-CoA thioesterase [Bacillus taeanensis]